MEFIDVIRKREATRSFKDVEVDIEIINKILECGILAPTAKNMQPTKIYVVRSQEGLDKIDLASPCRYGAKTVLLVCSDKQIAWKKEDYSTFEMDATIVATHIMLAATNYGVDNIWVEMFDKNIIKEQFNLDENIEPICLIPIGYQKDDYQGSVFHNQRKELEEVVEYV